MRAPRRDVFAGAIAVLGGTAMAAVAALGACSDDSPAGPFFVDAGPEAAPLDFDTGAPAPQPDAQAPPPDVAVPPSCPGAPIAAQTSPACAIDQTESCPSCASWGFVCPGLASPQLQGGTAAPLCRSTAFDAGEAGVESLVCCTVPMCIVSESDAGCTGDAAPTATRYECSGSAVPTGACVWQGASAPNDYCCQ